MQKLYSSQGSLKCLDYNVLPHSFCCMPQLSERTSSPAVRQEFSSCTSPPLCWLRPLGKAAGKEDLPLGMEGAPRKCNGCVSAGTCREVHTPGSWRVRQAGECKTCHRVNMLSLQMLSCYQLFKSFQSSGNLPPVHLRNSGKFLNP